MKKFVGLIAILLTTVIYLAGQDNLKKEYVFDSNSSAEDLEFEVSEDIQVLSISMDGKISKGTLKVGLYRPNGDRSGGFELKASGNASVTSNVSVSSSSNANISNVTVNTSSNSSSSTNKSSSISSNSNSTSESETSSNCSTVSVVNVGSGGAKGNMCEVVSSPEAGTWRIKIDPSEVEGKLCLKIEKE